MSEDDSRATLRRSPSGNLWPQSRPPLNRSASSGKLTREVSNFYVNESSFDESTNEHKLRHEESLGKTDIDDDELTNNSEENTSHSHISNDSDDSLEEDFEEINREELENTSLNKKGAIDSSVLDEHPKKYHQTEKKSDDRNQVFDTDFLRTHSKWFSCGGVLILSVILGCCYAGFPSANMKSNVNRNDLSRIKNHFRTQDEDLWTAFETGVQDVIRFNKPSIFIFLYNKDAENTLENLLKQLNKYAVCELTDCSKEAIVITDIELNSPEIVEDYGIVIDRYKNKLQENGVMVVKHLENVKGIPAQAFHSYCDEFFPLVDKSILIFTMEVDKIENQSNIHFVEEYFKKKWADIKFDTFTALITRMTSMVLEIKP